MTAPRIAYTREELLAEARAQFGDDPLDFAFVCPRCGDVATLRDFREAGDSDAAGQLCVGRLLGALRGPRSDRSGITRGVAPRGCNWSASGLIAGPWVITMPSGRKVPSFALAPARQVAAGTRETPFVHRKDLIMSVKLGGALPQGDQNGLSAISAALCENPEKVHVAVVLHAAGRFLPVRSSTR